MLTGLQIQKLASKNQLQRVRLNTCLAFAMKLAAKKGGPRPVPTYAFGRSQTGPWGC